MNLGRDICVQSLDYILLYCLIYHWYCIVLHYIVLLCVVLHFIKNHHIAFSTLTCITLHCTALNIALYCTNWWISVLWFDHIVLHYLIYHSTTLYGITFHRTVLYCIILNCTVVHRCAPYCTVVHCIVPHCISSARGGGDISVLSGQWVTWGALLGGPSSYAYCWSSWLSSSSSWSLSSSSLSSSSLSSSSLSS